MERRNMQCLRADAEPRYRLAAVVQRLDGSHTDAAAAAGEPHTATSTGLEWEPVDGNSARKHLVSVVVDVTCPDVAVQYERNDTHGDRRVVEARVSPDWPSGVNVLDAVSIVTLITALM